jgi:translation elongation factor EF-G
MHQEKITININQRPVHFDQSVITPEQFRSAVSAAADYEVWKIVKDPDPEGQLPLDDVQITAPVEVKSGERFRVVPPGTFGC